MNARLARTIAWTLVGIYILLAGVGLTLQGVSHTPYTQTGLPALIILVSLVGVWMVTGALIISRHPQHPVGWLLCVGLFFSALDMFSAGYAAYDTYVFSSSLPGVDLALIWLKLDSLGSYGLVAFTLIVLLFPDGKFLSPGWRKLAWTAIVALLILLLLQAVEPGPVDPYTLPTRPNPLGVDASLWGFLKPLMWITFSILLLCYGAAFISLIIRLRNSSGDVRQQIKWLTFPVGLVGIFFLLFTIGIVVRASEVIQGAILAFGQFAVAGIVIAIAFAIFKYHLYDIDIIINRTLVYGALTVSVVLIYILIVGGLGTFFQAQDNLVIALLATGMVAVLFQPLREWLQRRVNKLIYGERDDPIEALSRLGKQMELALSSDQVLPVLVKTIAQTLKLPFVGITLKGKKDISFGQETGNPVAFPFIFQGETTGVLFASPRGSGESFTLAETRLLQNLARQAGAAVRNAQLTADLQRSRQTLVTAREEERHRLRRDLHDGIGPTMAGLTLKLDAAKDLVSSGLESEKKEELEEAVQLLGELKIQTQETVQSIRHIVHTLRPPSLDVLGLVPALQAHFGQVGTPRSLDIQMTTIPHSTDFPYLSAAVEVAVYRIVLEAVTNVINHAQAGLCEVSLILEKGNLKMEIKDDGIGLPKTYNQGIGLDSMRERAEELGGHLELFSSPQGTRVCAEIPVAPARNEP
jgi:two-component system NarL family sensor kinase